MTGSKKLLHKFVRRFGHPLQPGFICPVQTNHGIGHIQNQHYIHRLAGGSDFLLGAGHCGEGNIEGALPAAGHGFVGPDHPLISRLLEGIIIGAGTGVRRGGIRGDTFDLESAVIHFRRQRGSWQQADAHHKDKKQGKSAFAHSLK